MERERANSISGCRKSRDCEVLGTTTSTVSRASLTLYEFALIIAIRSPYDDGPESGKSGPIEGVLDKLLKEK